MKPIYLAIILILTSCVNSSNYIHPWNDYDYVYNQYERTDFEFDYDKNHYMLYSTLRNLEVCLSTTPKNKIDYIINENPSWQFVFYCNCSVADSTQLMSVLRKYDCQFPVIIDPNRDFLEVNDIDESYTMIGYFSNKKGKCLGGAIIGTSQSFFDQEFKKVKAKIRN